MAAVGYDATRDVEQWLMQSGDRTISVAARPEDGLTLQISSEDPDELSLPVYLMDGRGRRTEREIRLGADAPPVNVDAAIGE